MECFTYKSGVLVWNKRPSHHFKSESISRAFNSQFSGEIAGTERKKGSKRYSYVAIGDKTYSTHSLVWFIYNGRFPENCIDHINGNSLDNRIENLRDVTKAENNRNIKRSAFNKSGCTGVSWRKDSGKWVVRIGVRGSHKNFGSFDDLELAELIANEVHSYLGYHQNHGAMQNVSN
jgi:hypothetical protein